MITKYDKISFTKLLGTLLIDRVSDTIMVGLITLLIFIFNISFFTSFFAKNPALLEGFQSMFNSIWIYVAVIIFVAVIWFVFTYMSNFTLVQKAKGLLKNVWTGMKSIWYMEHKMRFVIETLLIWGGYFCYFYITFYAFDFTKDLGIVVGLITFTMSSIGVAADLLSQAEHDEMASAILITTDGKLAEEVSRQAERFAEELSRKEIIRQSLENYGYILVADSMEDAVEAANEIASEHLEILTANPYEVMAKIKNAGAIFLGEYSSEPLGDYFAGPNHILPTNGTAKFFSPLNVDDFLKKTSIISYSKEALEAVHKEIEKFAESEGLTAHANSIKVRFE